MGASTVEDLPPGARESTGRWRGLSSNEAVTRVRPAPRLFTLGKRVADSWIVGSRAEDVSGAQMVQWDM